MFAMEREAASFRRRGLPVHIRVSGIGREKARSAIEAALRESKPDLVIAAGFCGAIVPDLKVGDIIESPHILTVDHLVGDPHEKARLAERTGARAVDMESAAIAAVCAESGIAFIAIRAVSDTSGTALSPGLAKLLSGGHVSIPKACLALVKRPSLLREFLRLSRDTKLAARKLADALAERIDCTL